jgi:UDP-N-acetylmuramate dehydrogenase
MVIKNNVSLASLSTFRIGGKAEYFCAVKNFDELIKAIKWAREKKIPWQVFAGGSNIVFPDGKLKGLLIQIKNGLIRADRGNKRLITVDAGVLLADVIKKSISLGWRGLETLSGIPGTVGGAIVGNAGAYGHSISEVVQKVEILDEKLKPRWFTKAQCKFAYRESIFKHRLYIVLRAVMKFEKGNKKALQKISRDIIKIRLKRYKPELKCPGSFFKNVVISRIKRNTRANLTNKIDKKKIIDGKIPAGYLLEQVGAKGMRIGGIEIAKFHGNLFINRGDATARDVKRLAKLLKGRVYRKFGIKLEEEIRYF